MEQCTNNTSKNTRCKRLCKNNSLCWQHEQQTSEHDTCPICYDVVGKHKKFTLDCGHKYHKKCISRWFKKGQISCPMCRKTVSSYILCVCGVKYSSPIDIDMDTVIYLLSRILDI